MNRIHVVNGLIGIRSIGASVFICVYLWFICFSGISLQAQNADPYGIKPKNHERNKALAASRYAAALTTHKGQTNILVLPGLIADRANKRVEVWAERSAVERNAACEFMLVGEQSDHTYETLFISFAKPSDVHRALEFLGVKAGESFDPTSLRFWPKGESFVIRVAREGKPSIPVESFLLDRRTGKSIPEGSFMFTGSRQVTAHDGASRAYAADVMQPMSLISLFNTFETVLQVPQRAPKSVIYQNTVIRPEAPLEDEGLLTLLIERAHQENRVKELELEVTATEEPVTTTSSEADRLKALRVHLKDHGAVLVERAPLPALLERLAKLDRDRQVFFLTVRFRETLALGHARAMAGVLALIDSDKGVRVEPPPSEQLYYRAFTPDRDLLDRKARIFHPLELVISEFEGTVSGRLFLVNPAKKQENSPSQLEIREVPIPGPAELRRQVEAESHRMQEENHGSRPPILMVFAPSTMTCGKLTKFLTPLLATHRTIHVYLDEPSSSLPR